MGYLDITNLTYLKEEIVFVSNDFHKNRPLNIQHKRFLRIAKKKTKLGNPEGDNGMQVEL